MKELDLLPGIPEDLVRAAFARAGGDELRSGKFANPQSSAALAANGFGWFLERPDQLPPFPGLEDLDWPARPVANERQMRLPWRGGRRVQANARFDSDHETNERCWTAEAHRNVKGLAVVTHPSWSPKLAFAGQ